RARQRGRFSSEIPQNLRNWQVRPRPRQAKECGDQNPRPPIVVGRHASAPITGMAAKRARMRAEADFLNETLTHAAKRAFVTHETRTPPRATYTPQHFY